MSITVIKLGGSLQGGEHLLPWLRQIQIFARDNPVVIVPGGGLFADAIREQQQRLGFDDLTAHRMALLAMCQSGYLLKGLCPLLDIVSDSGAIIPAENPGLPLLWLPFELLNDQTDLPASWDYTSDSIALWLSSKIQAKALILVKARRLGDSETDLKYLIKEGVLDKGIQSLITHNKSRFYIFSAADQDFFSEQMDWSRFHLKTPLTV